MAVEHTNPLPSTDRPGKRAKLEKTPGEGNNTAPLADKEGSVSGPPLADISEYSVTRCLGQSDDGRTVFTLGKLKDKEGDAIVMFENNSIDYERIKTFISPDSNLELSMNNDIFNIFSLDPPRTTNTIKTTVIYPATPKLINKYTYKSSYLVRETPDIYRSVTEPYFQQHLNDHQWVYNILEGKKEVERVLYRDEDEAEGFVLVADLKWDTTTPENLYCLAIVNRRDLMSVRDLRRDHVSMLQRIRDEGLKVIKTKFGVPASLVRIFLHYQPAYYHLHVHFSHLRYHAGSPVIGKSLNLNDVIQNIEFVDEYYEQATLQYYIKDGHGLCSELDKHGYIIR